MRKSIIICILTAVYAVANAQNFYQNGIDEFFKNDFSKASDNFLQVKNKDNNYPYANLFLALIQWNYGVSDEGLAYFEKFCKSTPDYYPYFYAYFPDILNDKPYSYSKKQIAFAQKALRDIKLPYLLRAKINNALGNYYFATNRLPNAQLHYSAANEINVDSIKKFDVESALRNNKNFGVLQTISLIYIYLQKDSINSAFLQIQNLEEKYPNSIFIQQLKNKVLSKMELPDNKQITINAIMPKIKKGVVAYPSKTMIDTLKNTKLIAKLYKTYPYNFALFQKRYSVERETNKLKYLNLLKKYDSQYKYEEIWGCLYDYYFTEKDTINALKEIKNQLNYFNNPLELQLLYIDKLFENKQVTIALQKLDSVKQENPKNADIYQKEGFFYKSLGNKIKADTAFSQAMTINPVKYACNEELMRLYPKNYYEQYITKINLDDYIKTAKSNIYGENIDVLHIVTDKHLYVYSNCNMEYYCELATKILTENGVKKNKQFQIDFFEFQDLTIETAEIIKPNGQKITANADKNGKINFQNLETGDIIHIIYKLKNRQGDDFAKDFGDYIMLNTLQPSIYNRYALIVPNSRHFNYTTQNGSTLPTITPIEDFSLYQWITTNKYNSVNEPFMPDENEIAEKVTFSSIHSWNMVIDGYKSILQKIMPAQNDIIFKKKYNEIIAGKENLPALKKAELFYNYINTNINDSNGNKNLMPQKPSVTLLKQKGTQIDLAVLFIAFCRQAGIDANLLCLQNKTPFKDTSIPTYNFDNFMVSIYTDNYIHFIDVSNKTMPFGSISNELIGSKYLRIPVDDGYYSTMFFEIPSSDFTKNGVIKKQTITMNGENFDTKFSINFTGEAANFAQKKLNGKTDNEKEIFLSNYMNKNTKIDAFTVKNQDNITNIEGRGVVQLAVQIVTTDNLYVFSLPWNKFMLVNEMNLLQRITPFEFKYFFTNDVIEETIVVNIPAGLAFGEIPHDKTLSCTVASYELKVSYSDENQIIFIRRIQKTGQEVSTKDYIQFRDFMYRVSAEDSRQYAFISKSTKKVTKSTAHSTKSTTKTKTKKKK